MTNEIKEKTTTEAKFNCPVCNKPIKNKLGLYSHLRTHHKTDIDKTCKPVIEEIKSMPVLDIKTKVEEPEPLTWVKKNGKKKTSLPLCIIIDKYNRWHEKVPVNLGNINPLPFTWGYYGNQFPVLVEKNDKLEPYLHSDMVGESCNRLYKAGQPDGFKNTFKHTNSLLQKIQLGLMVIIVIAIFFLIYILINR